MACGEFSLIARYFDRVKACVSMWKPASATTALSEHSRKKTLAISTDTGGGQPFYLISILPIWLTRRWRSI